MRTGPSRQYCPLARGRQVFGIRVLRTPIKAYWTRKPSARSKPINCSIRSTMPQLMPGSACFTARLPDPESTRQSYEINRMRYGSWNPIPGCANRYRSSLMQWRARNNLSTNCSTAHSSVAWPSIVPESERKTWNSAVMDTINLSMAPTLWLTWSKP